VTIYFIQCHRNSERPRRSAGRPGSVAGGPCLGMDCGDAASAALSWPHSCGPSLLV